ncbi:MAG: HAMP domain-containing histidine kinase, partial [Armatimonadetes bacterium]|nr:HAMP domain-containing histidine kinase [Armatimonadota bacterium]
HELNNPLTSILCLGELLQEQSAGELLDSLVQEAGRCRKLVADLLQVARKEQAEMAPVQLGEVVESTLPMIRKQFDKDGVELEVESSSDLSPVLGNPDHLRQVVLNLLSNALSAVGQQGHGKVELRVIERGGRVLLVVGDNGPGIQPRDLGRIFDPFFTTKAAGEGTGLGLSILQKIVTDHRGTVQVSNRAGGGALFTVELPIAAVEPAEAS